MMNGTTPAAWYALRRTLPPWRFDELLNELAALAPQFKIDEVIIKIDTEEFSHGHPDIAWAQAYQPRLQEVKQTLDKLGIVYSLNPWITVGHCDRGRDDREQMPGLGTIVGHDGSETKHCACPLSEVWRERLTALWTIYAETKPHIMWIEDDIRTFNHEPVRFGCFCDRHMELFSQRVGEKVDREALVEAMLRPGKPHPWRAEYMAMQREIMIETAGWLGKLVHRVSPDTCMGLMSSGPRQHCLEGRDWIRFAEALADGKPLYSRPPMANYNEDSLRGFYYSHDSIKLTRHVMPKGTIEQTEVENVPFSRFSKSINFTFLEMAISFAYGSHGVTLNLFDHVGTPLAEEAAFGRMLAEKKPYLNALAAATQPEGSFRGVRLLHHPEASMSKQVPAGCDYQELAEDGFAMMQALESHGIPTTFDAAKVTAVSGQTLRSYSDAELRQLLATAVLLDAPAAQVLVERGFGSLIGMLEVKAPVHRRELPWVICAEEFHHPQFGGANRQYMTTTLPFLGSEGKFSVVTPAEGVEVVSSWVDPDTCRVAPAMTACVNSLGGRVVVHAVDYASAFGVSFCHPFRRRQLHGVVRWLSAGAPELLFSCDGAYPLAWRKSAGADTEIVGSFNFNLDDWQEVQFDLAWNGPLPQARCLDGNGCWQADPALSVELTAGILSLRYAGTVSYRLPLVIRLAR